MLKRTYITETKKPPDRSQFHRGEIYIVFDPNFSLSVTKHGYYASGILNQKTEIVYSYDHIRMRRKMHHHPGTAGDINCRKRRACLLVASIVGEAITHELSAASGIFIFIDISSCIYLEYWLLCRCSDPIRGLRNQFVLFYDSVTMMRSDLQRFLNRSFGKWYSITKKIYFKVIRQISVKGENKCSLLIKNIL